MEQTIEASARNLRPLKVLAWCFLVFDLLFSLFCLSFFAEIKSGDIVSITITLGALLFSCIMINLVVKPVGKINRRFAIIALVSNLVLLVLPIIFMSITFYNMREIAE